MHPLDGGSTRVCSHKHSAHHVLCAKAEPDCRDDTTLVIVGYVCDNLPYAWCRGLSSHVVLHCTNGYAEVEGLTWATACASTPLMAPALEAFLDLLTKFATGSLLLLVPALPCTSLYVSTV